MIRRIFFATMLFSGMLFTQCKRVEYFPDNPVEFTGTKFLGHRGGGYFDEGNTLAGCKYGLSLMDGIECDIQKSKNNTLWLSHSATIMNCDTSYSNCFASISNAKIDEINSCFSQELAYARLDSVFEYMQQNYPAKYISLDVKAWEPCELGRSNLINEMNDMAQAIIDLTVKYNLENKVVVESETGDFLYYIKTNCNFIETYLTTLGDFELGAARALHAGFSGLSFKFNYLEHITKEHVDLIRKKGLKIQLWTLNDNSEIGQAMQLEPDYIQTDNLEKVVNQFMQ